jgi:HTH-type transcriptional repressor of NAD biosynthesis genes
MRMNSHLQLSELSVKSTASSQSMASRQFERGLVVGKFCPLHRGHEWLIGQALTQCQEVIVISYNKPEYPGYEPERRAAWLQKQFPQTQRLVLDDASLKKLAASRALGGIPEIPHNHADEHDHRLFVAWLCQHLLQKTVDAVFTSEDYGDGFASVLTEYFLRHNPSAKSVTHICVDKARKQVPISGTAVRSDPHKLRHFLAPEVYADFVRRVCFLGGESSGKTTLAQTMAQTLDTLWVPEFGRELWEQQKGMLLYEDMLKIALAQVERETQKSGHANRWLFCDTSPLTTLFYSRDLFGHAEEQLFTLAERHYAKVFLCAPDFAFVQDGTRRGDTFRQQQHLWYLTELDRRRIPFTPLEGDINARIDAVKKQLRPAHLDTSI